MPGEDDWKQISDGPERAPEESDDDRFSTSDDDRAGRHWSGLKGETGVEEWELDRAYADDDDEEAERDERGGRYGA